MSRRSVNLTVVVKSCQRDRNLGFHDVIRETWGKDLLALGGDLKFVTAGTSIVPRRHDEINLPDCLDDYHNLPDKVHHLCNWSYLQRWGHIFLCDTDTLVNPKKLLALPYKEFDYAGGFKGGQKEVGIQIHYTDLHLKEQWLWPWASGGYGYFLSPKAQAWVGATPPMVWAEDMYVGQVMGPKADMKIAAFPMTKITTHIPKTKGWSPEILWAWYTQEQPTWEFYIES